MRWLSRRRLLPPLIITALLLLFLQNFACSRSNRGDLVSCAYNFIGPRWFAPSIQLIRRHLDLHPDRKACSGLLPLAPAEVHNQWPVCEDNFDFVEQADGGLATELRCTAYSFGVTPGMAFESALADAGCDVFAYDMPSNLATATSTSRIHVHAELLSYADNFDTTRNVQLRSLPTALKQNQHHRADVIRIDAHGVEWAALLVAMRNGGIPANVLIVSFVWTPLNSLVQDGTARAVLADIADLGFTAYHIQEDLNNGWFVPWEHSPPHDVGAFARMRCCFTVFYHRL